MARDADPVTHLTDAVEPRPEEGLGPRVGDPVQLRLRPGGLEIEAWSPRLGRRLGRLPPDIRDSLAGLVGDGASIVSGRVSALVPRPGWPRGARIHISVPGVPTDG